jgi:hypothetical protein
MSTSLSHRFSQENHTHQCSATRITFTYAHPHARPTQQIFFLTTLHMGVICSSSSKLSSQRRLIHHFISVSERCTHLMGFSTCSPMLSHRHVQLNRSSFSLCYIGESSKVSSQLSAQRRPAQRHSFVSDRNHISISWAHPSHGLSLKSTQSVCVLEDVSRSCNHQHSLLAREAFSIMPSLVRKYSNFVLVVIINTPSQLERYSSPGQFGEDVYNMLMCRKILLVYCFPLHHVSEKLNFISTCCILS